MSRKRIILSDDEDDEVQVVQKPKKVISLEDEEDQASDGLYFTNEDFANSGKTTQSKQKKIELVDNEDSEDHTKRYKPSSSKDQAFNSSSNQPNTRQSSRRQVLSTKHEKQRIEAERELKRLYKKGLDSVLEEESEEEVEEEEDDDDYPEVDEDEEEEYEESEEERPKKKSKITGKKALDAYNASGYHKQRSNYSNSVVARCLKDYDKEDNRYYSDLDDFIVDDDEEEEEEEEEIEEVAKPRKPKAKRKSKRVEESDEEENEQQQESDEGSEVIKRKRKKDKKNHKLQLSSEDEDDQKSEEEEEEGEEEASEEDDEESLDGNLLYFRVNQMRESKEHEIEETGDIAGMLGFRKSYPVPEAMAYYIEYIGKCLISKDAFRDAPKSSPHLAAARQIENLICTNRESLLGSSAWRQDFLKELQHRPFYVHFKTAGHYFNDCNDEKCQACGRGTHRPDHRVSLFGPTYEAMRIWENHWIDLIPKALLLHNSKKNSSSSSGTPKTPSRKTQTSSPATTHSANTPSVSRNPSRGSKQLEIVQSSLQPPNSLTKRRLSLSPITNRSSSLNNSASKSKTTSDQASPSKKRNAIILSDSEDEIQIVEQPVDLTVEDSLMLQKEETRAFSDHVVSTEKDSAEPADEEIRNDQNGDEEDSDHSDSTNTTDTDNDEREKSEKKSKRRFRHKKIEWWEKKLPKELVHEEETTWNLSFHCKNRTQLYHTLLHYKFRLLLKIYEYFDKVNGANCELSELTLEELQRLYNTMINDHSFIHEEANRFQSLIRTAGNRWGGDKYEAQMDIWRNDNQIFERRERILGDKKGSKSKRKHDEVENVDDKKTNYQPESEHETKKQRGGQKRVLSFNTTRQPKHQSSMMDWFATSSK